MAALHFFHFMVSLCLPFFFCVTFFILRDLVSNFFAGAGLTETTGLSEGDSELPGVAESVGEGLTTGVVVGTEVSAGVPVAVGTAESVGKGVFVGTGFPEGVIAGDGDADAPVSFFKSSMICCSEFFRFRRGVI